MSRARKEMPEETYLSTFSGRWVSLVRDGNVRTMTLDCILGSLLRRGWRIATNAEIAADLEERTRMREAYEMFLHGDDYDHYVKYGYQPRRPTTSRPALQVLDGGAQ